MQHNAPSTTTAEHAPARAGRQPGKDYSLHFVLLATVGFFLARLPIIPIRSFDPDEFQHAHAAWCVWKGMLPYKDFFEHHTPWYYYTLSPFFRWFEVDVAFASAKHFLMFGRGLSLALTVLAVLVVILIGRLWEERRVGLVAGLFLVGQPVFFEKTLEIRPDVLALPFYLGALWFLLRGLGRAPGTARRHSRFLAAGLCLGAAIMSTQKMLFVLPGLLSGLAVWVLFAVRRGKGRSLPTTGASGAAGNPLADGSAEPGPRSRVLSSLAFVLGLCIPGVLTFAAFAVQRGSGEFISNNFLLNAEWKHTVGEQLLKFLETSWPILLLSLFGASLVVVEFVRSARRSYGGLLLVSTLLGLIAGVLVVPAAHRQYYLMLLPIVCLLAAKALSFLLERARARVRPWLLALAIVPLSVLPVLDLRAAFATRNDRQLDRLREVLDSTQPTDLVMDGWHGTGVFRPHAFYYFFVHEELADMLSRERVDAYLDALESGRIRPRLIAMDENLLALGSRFARFVHTHYVSRDGFLYFRKEEAH
ncbi:MAG: glycosyltransferase family 39 protein [Deltaproteobacteria bacterium]|nr:glycosyltransferase family 39 protein [Deltaproteobacteria bacterium]